jgi:pyridoxine/pyridoxamine 5'-phosphate oxidase
MNALTQFHIDRDRARSAKDAMANVCTVANVDKNGSAQLRTLVLRDVEGQLAIFINATSPKWPHLQSTVSLLCYWPSISIQYRIMATVSAVPEAIVQDSWQLRPPVPKQMDWLYETWLGQSSEIPDRDTLLKKLAEQALPAPLTASDNARGLLLAPQTIERLDLVQGNGVHDRSLATLTATGWTSITLVP